VFCIHEKLKLIKYISVLFLPVIVNSNTFFEPASYILEQIVQPTYVRTRANNVRIYVNELNNIVCLYLYK